MKVAVNLPTKYLYVIDWVEKALGSNGYHLVIAPKVGEDKVYTDYYKGRSMIFNDIIIMDNGTPELGHPLPTDELVRKAELLGADIIVLPDEIDNYKKTLQNTRSAIVKFEEAIRGSTVKLNYMFVLQRGFKGNVVEDILSLPIDVSRLVIGVPKWWQDERVEVLEQLNDRANSTKKHLKLKVHLLGNVTDWLSEIERIRKRYKNWKNIELLGVDSTLPFMASVEGKLIEEYVRPDILTDGFHWEDMSVDVDILFENVYKFMYWWSTIG